MDLLNVYTSLAWMFCFPNRGHFKFVTSFLFSKYSHYFLFHYCLLIYYCYTFVQLHR